MAMTQCQLLGIRSQKLPQILIMSVSYLTRQQ
jgi:hypothetical protein